MSGGSFNYLCDVPSWDIISNVEDLKRMRDALLEYDALDAATECEAVLATIKQFQVLVDVRLKRMHEVFKAVEWHASGDGGIEGVQRALAAYREGMR
jgi:hypothetical protein